MAKPVLTYWTVYDDGEPWGIFCEKHVDPSQFVEEDVRRACADSGCELADEQLDEIVAIAKSRTFQHLWMSQHHPEEGDDPELQPDEESPWHWCQKEDLGAKPVTGMSLQ